MALRMTAPRVLLLAVATLAVAVAVLDLSGGSTSEAYGVVKSVTRATSDGKPAGQVVDVRLASGKLVQASLADGVAARAGDKVHLRVLSRISGDSTYQVLDLGQEMSEMGKGHS